MNVSYPGRFSLALVLLGAANLTGRAEPAWRDRPLKIIQTTDPVFPKSFEMQSLLHGEVRLIINIDAEGRLADWLVTSYTHRDFADAAVKALKEWRYEPAQQRGEPVGIRAGVVFNFEVEGRIVSFNSLDNINSQINKFMGDRSTERVCLPHELDQPLKAVQTVMPRALGPGKGDPKTVVIDFYVDEAGRPRMPVVLDLDDLQLAESALNALMQWRYSVPTREGEPVAVRAQQAFVFAKSS